MRFLWAYSMFGLLLLGCGNRGSTGDDTAEGGVSDPDRTTDEGASADSDGDMDADTDTDADVDADTDADSDMDAETDTETDTSSGPPQDTTRMIKDFNPGQRGGSPYCVVELNKTMYFAATSFEHGNELWTSDGTVGGAGQVADITLGHAGTSIRDLIVFGDHMYFTGEDGMNDRTIWRSDGTPEGTTMLFVPSSGTSLANPFELTVAAGRLYFGTTRDDGGGRLWVSDGTKEGTVALADVSPGGSRQSQQPEYGFTPIGKHVFFSGDDEVHGTELWKTDGTVAGTSLVSDIAAGAESSSPCDFAVLGEKLLFVITKTDEKKDELWQSDGTAAGTKKIRDLLTDEKAWTGFDHDYELTSFKQHVYFRLALGNGPEKLWRTDGTTEGTEFFYNNAFSIWRLAAMERDLYFWAGEKLWASDGTPAGTRKLVDAVPPPGKGFTPGSDFVQAGELVFFTASDASHGKELWRTDGTAEETIPVETAWGYTGNLTKMNEELYFTVDNFDGHSSLWKIDGEKHTAERVANFRYGDSEGRVDLLTSAGGLLYFALHKENGDLEIWRSDGSEAGTKRLNNLGQDTIFYQLVALGDDLFFVLFDQATKTAIWKSDKSGTELELLMKIWRSYETRFPLFLVDGKLFFLAEDTDEEVELWVSDGTTSGTRVVKHFNPDPKYEAPTGLTAVSDKLVFTVDDGIHGYELWRTDGSASGTVMVKNIFPDDIPEDWYTSPSWEPPEPDAPVDLFAVEDGLFFSANDMEHGYELWYTNEL